MISRIAQNLARIGHFAQAEHVASLLRSDDHFLYIQNLEHIAEQRVVRAARKSPDKPADLAPIIRLAEISGSPSPPLTLEASAYYIAALDLLGSHPYDLDLGSSSHELTAPQPISRPTIARMIMNLEALIPRLPDNWRTDEWDNVAELHAAMGDGPAAMRALDAGMTKRSSTRATVRVLRLAPPAQVLSILRRHGAERADLLVDAAKAMQAQGEPPAIVVPILRRAFALAAKGDLGGPEFGQLRSVIQAVLELGDRVAAVELSQRALALARTHGGALPWHGLFSAAVMFIDVGDSRTARQIIDEAIATFPKNPSRILGVGLVAGPVTFSNWGLDDVARTDAVVQLYRLGDTRAFDRVLAEIRDKRRAWLAVIDQPDAPRLCGAALDRAIADVDPNGRRQFTSSVAAIRQSRGDREGALALANKLLDEATTSPGTPVHDYWALEQVARIALVAGEPDLAAAALRALVRAAIRTNSPLFMAQAAIFWTTRLPSIVY
jgi:hypothetical protein